MISKPLASATASSYPVITIAWVDPSSGASSSPPVEARAGEEGSTNTTSTTRPPSCRKRSTGPSTPSWWPANAPRTSFTPIPTGSDSVPLARPRASAGCMRTCRGRSTSSATTWASSSASGFRSDRSGRGYAGAQFPPHLEAPCVRARIPGGGIPSLQAPPCLGQAGAGLCAEGPRSACQLLVDHPFATSFPYHILKVR